MYSLSDILQVTIGVSSCGTVAWLGFKLLQIMTRYNILLAGQCVSDAANPDQEEQLDLAYPRRFRYRLRIQSLEPMRTEGALQVTIKGIPSGSHATMPSDHVWAVAGWKPIEVIQELGGSQNDPNKSTEPIEPYLWRAIFQELPAFDAWSFDVAMPCERLEFSVAFVGIEARKFLAPTFGPYFAPQYLTVFASDREEPRVKGSVTMPRPVVPVILSILAVSVYVLVTGLSKWQIEWRSFTSPDGWLIVSEVVLIWIGYAVIKRPVYPVISGYRFITPPWPKI
jgi:hypothetical protein